LREAGESGRALSALADAGPLPDALRQRAQLERELGRHAQRAETLEALIAQGGPDLDLHRELASLYANELRAPDAAIRHWEGARRLVAAGSPADVALLQSLADAQRASGRTAAWARHAEHELAALDPAPVFDDRRRELRRELAFAYDGELARSDAALAHLRALLDASDAALLGRETLDRVELACLHLLRADGCFVELERRFASRLARIGGWAADWLELAQIREETLRHTSSALDAYRKALESDATNLDALRGLRRTAERLGRWRDVAEALERELECTRDRDPADRGALLRALGDIHWHRLSSTTRASRYYAAALEANASDFAALRALERLLEAMEDWRGALDLYESEAEVLGAANPKRRREIWLHVASLAQERASDPERARKALQRAGEIEALDGPQLAELASLHEAVGDRDAFVAALAKWCDAPDTHADAADHLRLAVALEQLGRTGAAATRVERAVASHPERAEVWDAAARLRAAIGDPLGSARALARASEFVGDASLAAARLREAAARSTGQDPEAALALLREAVERSPEDAIAHVERARLAARLGKDDEAESAARAALEIAPGALDLPGRAAIARVGADAARRRGRAEAAASLYAESLRLEADDAGALGAYGETLFALGDHASARGVLERRLARGDRYAERATHCALLGRCYELAGQPEEALAYHGDALNSDPLHPVALESIVGVLEELDRIDPGIVAIERWARAARSGDECAARLLRAARWELRRGARSESAERHLRAAVTADASLAPAWIALAELQIEAGQLDSAIEATDRASAHVLDPIAFAALANLQGRALEQKGERREAALLFGIAAECDPRCAEAALARARLLRGFGEWREAAAALRAFADRHPSTGAPALAEIYEQLGRLLAGPLEDLESAVLSYRRAIELAPERIEARAALAELLSHRPGDWDEALEQHKIVLASRPTHAGCLRVALRIARGRAKPAAIATGVAIQRALGIATGYESEADAAGATPVTHEPTLTDARSETLRRLAVEAASELAAALGGNPPTGSAPGADPVAACRSRVLAVQGELTAPALLTRSARDVREVMQLLVQLALEPEQVSGHGNLVNALSEALGRRRRRKLRKILGEEATPRDFAGVDFEAWWIELRALAAAEVIRRDSTPLRVALVALIADSEGAAELAGEQPIAPHIEGEPAARALMRRIVDDWLGSL
jgi:tetratricopeptide (TPR) repeat protein